MGMLITIAFRNILRHKRRTLTSAGIIAFGVMYLIAMNSMYDGMDKAGTDNIIKLSTSSVKIQTKQYYQEKESFPFKYGITNKADVEILIKKYPEVKGISPRLDFLGELSNIEDSKPVVGKVVHGQKDTTVFGLTEYLEGKWFSSDSVNEIILGKEIAKDMAVDIGDHITLYALTRYESKNADDFTVVGILNTSDPGINKSSVLITYPAANIFLDLEDLITELDVSLYRQSSFDRQVDIMKNIQYDINSSFPELTALTFLETGADFINLANQKKVWGYFLIGVILLIAGVGIFNTVLMSVYERIREIGVLRAHGLKPAELTYLFTYESFITGIIGSVLGVIIGCFVNLMLVRYGIPLDRLSGNMDISGFPVWGTIYGVWNPVFIVGTSLFGVIVATVAGIIPARKAAKMAITKALHFV